MKALIDNHVKLEKHNAVECLVILKDVEKHNDEANAAVRNLCALLSKENLPFLIVKGQTLLPLYPQYVYRVSGDVDFFCPPSSFEKTKELLRQQWNIEWHTDEDEGFQHYACEHKGIEYELHFCLKKFFSRRSQGRFDALIETAQYETRVIDGVNVPVLPPHLEIAYTFLHMYHHLVNKGVSLRHFCDMAVLLHHGGYDAKKLREVLRLVDHEKAFNAVGAVLVDVLGLPEEEFPFSLTQKDYRFVKPLMYVVLKHGNFGFYGNKTKLRSGWKYYWESFSHKMRLQRNFYVLAPRETRNTILRSIPQKIGLAVRRQGTKKE